jgi:hypothetical protein
MATAARAAIEIVGQDKTGAAFRSADARMSDLGRKANGLAASFAGITAAIGGIAAALGTARIVGFVKDSIDAADAAAKQARSVGLAVEQVTALNYAAGLSGVSQEQLTTALQRLARTARDAGDGVKESAEAFASIGVSVKSSDGALKTSTQLLDEIADRFQKLPDGIQKTAIAQDIFGRSGAALINLLNGGRDGLEQFRVEAEKLGVVIGTDSALAAEKLNDNIERLRKNLEGLGNVLAAKSLPALNEFVTRIIAARDTFDSFGQFFRASLGAEVFSDAAKGVDFYTTRLQSLVSEQQRLVRGGSIFDRINSIKLDRPIAEAQKLLEFYQRVASASGALGAGAGRGSVNPAFALGPPSSAGSGADAAPDRRAQAASEAARRAAQRLADEQYALSFYLRDFGSEQSDAEMARLLRLNEQLVGQYKDEIPQAALTAEQAMRQAFNVSEMNYEEVDAAVAAINASLEKNNTLAQDLGFTFSSAFEDAIVSGRRFSDVLKSIGQDILRILLRQNITGPLSAAIGSFDFSSILPSFAVGTPYVPRDMVAQIHKGERIVTAEDNRRGAMGTPVMVNVKVETQPGQTAEVQQRQTAGGVDVLVRMVRQVLRDDVNAKGPISRDFAGVFGLNRAAGAARRG